MFSRILNLRILFFSRTLTFVLIYSRCIFVLESKLAHTMTTFFSIKKITKKTVTNRQFRIRRFKIRENMWWSCYLPWKKSDELTWIFWYFLTELHLLHSNWRNSKKLFQELIILMFSQGKNSKQTKNKQTNKQKKPNVQNS